MVERNYRRMPKKVSEMTEEEIEAFASAVYENMMAKFASDDLPSEAGESA